jgi:hypothetical protein
LLATGSPASSKHNRSYGSNHFHQQDTSTHGHKAVAQSQSSSIEAKPQEVCSSLSSDIIVEHHVIITVLSNATIVAEPLSHKDQHEIFQSGSQHNIAL